MGAIPERKTVVKSQSSLKTYLLIGGIIGGIFAVGMVYLAFYVSPEQVMERVEVIAVTPQGCIGETSDGFAVNIGQCNAQPGDFVVAPIDQKVKERQLEMNPTGR